MLPPREYRYTGDSPHRGQRCCMPQAKNRRALMREDPPQTPPIGAAEPVDPAGNPASAEDDAVSEPRTAPDTPGGITVIGDGNIIGDYSTSVVVKLTLEFLERLEGEHGEETVAQLMRYLASLRDLAGTPAETRAEAGAVRDALEGRTLAEVREDEDLLQRLGALLVKAAGVITLTELWDRFKAWVQTPPVQPVRSASGPQKPAPPAGTPQVPEDWAAPTYPSFEPTLVRIPAGEFLMGSDPRRDPDAWKNEQPQHRVYLPDYYISRAPITNLQYYAFTSDTGHRAPSHWQDDEPWEKLDHPVVRVSWKDAVAYCRWLARLTGKPYQLPTEAQWEKAARGTDGRIYPWGDQVPTRRLCNFGYSYNEGGTTPVGRYSPQGDSPYGCVDMAGNVWEWTRSLWGSDWSEPEFGYPYDPRDGRENLEAGDDALRVLRGGAFLNDSRYVRCAYRFRNLPYSDDGNRGFRVVVPPFL
jgi:formylglycine-generating enzyme required for sulfatase activity